MRTKIESRVNYLKEELKNVQKNIQNPQLTDEIRSFYEGIEVAFIAEIGFLEAVLNDDVCKRGKEF